MVCRGRYASAPRAGSRSTETFGAIGLAAGFGTAAGSEMGGRSRGGTYQVNSICTGARSWAVAGRNPQFLRKEPLAGFSNDQMHTRDASIALEKLQRFLRQNGAAGSGHT